jgi:hypothetical protein
LTRTQIDQLKKLSKKLGGLPVSEIIRRAIDSFLSGEGKK